MEAIVSTGILKIFSNVIDDIYDYAKDKLKREFNKELIKKRIPKLIEDEINHVRYIKTLWQVDRAVNIDDFYCDSHLLSPSNHKKSSKRYLMRSTSDLGTGNNIVIRGIAGQGKSILLRYLCTREFEAGNRIPIFIELRRIQSDETLLDHFSKFFEILNLPIDQDLFKVMSKSGKFIFFLDAFDEIDGSQKQKILNELDHLVATSPNCQFIVTSRPNSAIEMSPFFDVWTLDNLLGNEYKNVIGKLADSPKDAETIIQKIEAHKSGVSDLLCTPLLVTLLIISYKSYQKIPEQLSDFYESIFYVLLQRHDGTKPGFIRPRRCSINDNQYREIFDALCYETKKTKKSSFNNQEMYKLVNRAIKISNLNEDPDKYLKDIITVTCLILFEGNEYRFIHRSVQEYYASTFIKNRPESTVIRFYDACIDYSVWRDWDSELTFLSETDKYRYNKFFILSLCRKWIAVDTDDELLVGCPPMTIQRAKNIIGPIDIGWDRDRSPENPDKLFFVGVGYLGQIMDHSIVLNLFHLDYKALFKKIEKGEIIINQELFKDGKRDINKSKFAITLHQIIDEGFLTDELQSFAKEILDHLYNMWKQAYEYTTKQESFDIISDILSDN